MTRFQLVCQFTPTCLGENKCKEYRAAEKNKQHFRIFLFPSSTLWRMEIHCRFEAKTFEGKQLVPAGEAVFFFLLRSFSHAVSKHLDPL